MAADPLTAATVDDLLNFDDSDQEDPFNESASRARRHDDPLLSPHNGKRKAGDENDLDAALGLDEEVKIKKKRKPIAKLDEERLLSAPGIPKLRAIARSGKFSKTLRLKGKGHELSDVARLLNYYQLWLDSLYPRAKFADGLQLIEKVGHSRRLQVMRKEWIDEGKPGYIRDKEKKKEDQEIEIDDLYAGDEPARNIANKESSNTGVEANEDSLFIPDSRPRRDADSDGEGLPEDDELDALLAEQDEAAPRPLSSARRENEDSEGEDDLDALLAEQETSKAPGSGSARNTNPKPKPRRVLFDEDDDEDMDDLDALLAEQERNALPKTTPSEGVAQPSTAPAGHTETPGRDQDEDLLDDDDDLDALLAEQEARAGISSATPQITLPAATSDETLGANADEDGGADGGDMFSSSPLRNNEPFNSSRGRLLDNEESVPVPSDPVPLQSQETTEIMRATGQESSMEEAGRDENDQLDAGDMFSSSPVQNE